MVTKVKKRAARDVCAVSWFHIYKLFWNNNRKVKEVLKKFPPCHPQLYENNWIYECIVQSLEKNKEERSQNLHQCMCVGLFGMKLTIFCSRNFALVIACSCAKTKTETKIKAFVRFGGLYDEQTDPSMYHSTEAWFVRHRLYPEQTKTFVFGFVFIFVLAHEQPIITMKNRET